MSETYPDPVTRRLLTLSTMAATIMSALDSTIANVALPHIQGSVSASQDEITWVLTSYIVASAIAIPLTGWLATRIGRKTVMLVSVVGFTLTSMLCGFATNIGELVLFRMLQGMFGASLVPMSQAIMLDINPPEKHASAMAFWGMGAVLAPIFGPVLGGWLTENLSWRWVFFINVPVGIVTFFGISAFLGESRKDPEARLDLFGFAMLALAVGLLQIALDRGQQQDWFASTEICVEAALSLFFFYAFVVQMKTAAQPFIDLALFRDRNFVFGLFFAFMVGVMIFGVLALLPTMLQQLLGYPVVLTGLAVGPRGLGTMFAMLIVGTLVRYIESRLLVMIGLGMVSLSLYMMSGFSLEMTVQTVILSGVISGIGNGLTFVPLSTMTFATLSPQLRNAGTAMYTLIRSLGSAIGISVLQVMIIRNTAIVHARLVDGIRPDNPVLAVRSPDFDFDAPAAVARINGEITRQASMVSYIDSYRAMFVLVLLLMPLVMLLRPPRRGGTRDEAVTVHPE
jgi:DHA2 family multidrug resistance protein